MTNLWQQLTSTRTGTRSAKSLDFGEWVKHFQFNGLSYPLGLNQTLTSDKEEIGANFEGYVQGAYQTNGVVHACMLVRLLLFSEARFQFRRMVMGRPGEMFGTRALRLLEQPWPGGTTGDLLTHAIQDVDLAGNAFFARRPGPRLQRLRPDWVTIIRGGPDGDPHSIDAELVGYLYHEGGPASGNKPLVLMPNEVAHWAPIPDPLATHRGMSWLTPVLREIMGDSAATSHKLNYFRNGATPNLVISMDTADMGLEEFQRWIDLFEEEHEGIANAYKTLYLAKGASATPVGNDLKAIDFKSVQGAGETRIAAAAGVPPVIVGLSEGLAAATYSNYGQARRRLADGTMRPLWRGIAEALAPLTDVPAGGQLWYDDRDISFLQEDRKDASAIAQAEATTIKTLVDAGYEASSVIAAVDSGDMTRLVHTGLFSVQLQPPMPDQPASSSSED